jgi:hypothetical protein
MPSESVGVREQEMMKYGGWGEQEISREDDRQSI